MDIKNPHTGDAGLDHALMTDEFLQRVMDWHYEPAIRAATDGFGRIAQAAEGLGRAVATANPAGDAPEMPRQAAALPIEFRNPRTGDSMEIPEGVFDDLLDWLQGEADVARAAMDRDDRDYDDHQAHAEDCERVWGWLYQHAWGRQR